jgi:hypothetical protein
MHISKISFNKRLHASIDAEAGVLPLSKKKTFQK